MRKRRPVPIVPIAILIIGILANLATSAASAQAHWPGWLDLVRLYAWLALGLFAVALVYLTWRGAEPRAGKKRNLGKFAGQLAEALELQWDLEANRRRIFNPYALPVQWSTADSELFTSWQVVVKQASSSPGGLPEVTAAWAVHPAQLSGGDKDLADVFFRIPTRILVILGEPGAGKTILLVRFVLELLRRKGWKEGGPVPVILPMASWNPEEEDLLDWIHRWIASDPSGLARFAPGDINLVRELLRAGLILPVLDGFDEIPERLRGVAIVKLNRAAKPKAGLIMTSRTQEYRDAVQEKSNIRVLLDGAVGIKLLPLDAEIVTGYLKDASNGPQVARRWDIVTRAFTAKPPPPVAQALRTPLMVTLARAIYNPLDNEENMIVQNWPSELLDPVKFKEKEAVENYLLDEFVRSAYRVYYDSSDSLSHKWDYERARRWLIFLAQYQQEHENGAPEIAWWRLHDSTPRFLTAATAAIFFGIIAAIGYPYIGFGLGLIVGIVTGFIVRASSPSWEVRLLPAMGEGVLRGLSGGLIGGIIAGLIAAIVLPHGPKDYNLGACLSGGIGIGIAASVLGDLIASFAAGLIGGITVDFYEHAAVFKSLRNFVGGGSHVMSGIGVALVAILAVELANKRSLPSRGLKWSLIGSVCGFACGAIIGIIALIQIGGASGILVAVTAPIAASLTGGVAGAIESKPESSVPPIVVLRRDREAFLRSWIVFGAALGLITGVGGSLSPGLSGQPNGAEYGISVGLTNLIVPGLTLAFMQARWGFFAIDRCWLAFKGQLPWKLIEFMEDAYGRGVFRQVGAVYQFRHINLQRRIAGWQTEPLQESRSFP